jgi:hypothetical protein
MNRVGRWVFSLAVSFAACGPSTPPPQSPPNANVAAAAGATCDSAVSHMVDLMAADKPDAPPEAKQKIHDMFVSHCQGDAWSPQAIDCFNQMKVLTDGDRCAAMMTDAQKESLDKAMGPAPAPGAAPAAEPAATTPAPPPPPPSSSRSGTPKKSGDPCDGGN